MREYEAVPREYEGSAREYEGSTRKYGGSTKGVRGEYEGSTRGVRREYEGSTRKYGKHGSLAFSSLGSSLVYFLVLLDTSQYFRSPAFSPLDICLFLLNSPILHSWPHEMELLIA
jgi:hypothetical protein